MWRKGRVQSGGVVSSQGIVVRRSEQYGKGKAREGEVLHRKGRVRRGTVTRRQCIVRM